MSDSTLRRLHNLDLFAGCRRSQLRQIDQLTVTLDVPAGRRLCAEGHHGAEFFVMVDGVANLHSSRGDAALLGAGAWFGESALIDHAPRNATVTTVTDATVLVFGTREFHALTTNFPCVRDRLAQRPHAERTPALVGTPRPGPVPGGLTVGAVTAR